MTNEEKKELFEAWKGGDKTTYNKLYKDMYATVLDAVKANLDEDKQDSADSVAQDVMVKVFKSVDKLEDTSKADEWLKDIVATYMDASEETPEAPETVIADPITPSENEIGSSKTEEKNPVEKKTEEKVIDENKAERELLGH